jgi:hypothetical protein
MASVDLWPGDLAVAVEEGLYWWQRRRTIAVEQMCSDFGSSRQEGREDPDLNCVSAAMNIYFGSKLLLTRVIHESLISYLDFTVIYR